MKKILRSTFIISVIFLVVICLSGCFKEQITKSQYQLQEVESGVYAIYYKTHSRAPAYNYDVVIINCNGNIKTFEGNVNITYTNDNPYVEIANSNYANNDKVYVYVPYGSVKYARDVGIN